MSGYRDGETMYVVRSFERDACAKAYAVEDAKARREL
jgi:hypothetical protein